MSKGNDKWNPCKECSIMSLVMFNARREDFPIETIEETEARIEAFRERKADYYRS